MSVTEQEINAAYATLEEKTTTHEEIAVDLLDLTFELEKEKAKALSKGVEGKNQAERDATLNQMFNAEMDKIHEVETELKIARLNLDLARLEVERVRALLRLEEVLKA